jgi:hypothetical protein
MNAPFWPGMMSRKTAIAYLDVSEAEFDREIAAGRLPEGVTFGGKPHWRKDTLDRALAVIAGEVTTAHIEAFEERRRAKRA